LEPPRKREVYACKPGKKISPGTHSTEDCRMVNKSNRRGKLQLGTGQGRRKKRLLEKRRSHRFDFGGGRCALGITSKGNRAKE